jgi:hypothetical protein
MRRPIYRLFAGGAEFFSDGATEEPETTSFYQYENGGIFGVSHAFRNNSSVAIQFS